jgi:hypothetical protein
MGSWANLPGTRNLQSPQMSQCISVIREVHGDVGPAKTQTAYFVSNSRIGPTWLPTHNLTYR